MLGLFRLQPQLLKPSNTDAAFAATISALSGDIRPALAVQRPNALAIPDDHLPAAHLCQCIGGQSHLFIVRTNNNHLVAIMCHSRPHCAIPFKTKPVHQTHLNAPGAVVAFDQRNFENILFLVGQNFPVDRLDGQF